MPLSQQRRTRNVESVGDYLREMREKAGYTPKALADEVGLEHYPLINQMELGFVAVPAALWMPLAAALNIDQCDFVLRCLQANAPDVYDAMYKRRDRREVAKFLRAYLRGQIQLPAEMDEKEAKVS